MLGVRDRRLLRDGMTRERLDPDEERLAVREVIAILLAHSERLALTRTEAADRLGVSVEFFEQHIASEIRCVRRGRRRLFPLAELVYWLWRSAD